MPDPLADLARLEGVPSAVTAARAAVDAVLQDRGMRAISSEQSASALLAGARASAALTDDPDRWLGGSVRLSTQLLALSALIRVSPGQALAQVHALVAHGSVPDDDLGRVRPGEGIAARMLGVNALLTGSTTASPIILAAVVHAELATVAPFGSADSIVARAAEHMVLVAGGVDPRAVIVVEAGHLGLQAEYRKALAEYHHGSVAAVRAWLLHSGQALARGAEVSPVARR